MDISVDLRIKFNLEVKTSNLSELNKHIFGDEPTDFVMSQQLPANTGYEPLGNVIRIEVKNAIQHRIGVIWCAKNDSFSDNISTTYNCMVHVDKKFKEYNSVDTEYVLERVCKAYFFNLRNKCMKSLNEINALALLREKMMNA